METQFFTLSGSRGLTQPHLKTLRMPKGVWRDSVALGHIASDTMEQKAGGDKDIYTKSGRNTKITLNADNIRLSDDGKEFLVDIYYEVKECQKNFTMLTWQGTAHCPIPVDAKEGSAYAVDTRFYGNSWFVAGQQHGLMPLPYLDGTCIDEGVYSIDGPTNDDTQDAAVELWLEIPFVYFDARP